MDKTASMRLAQAIALNKQANDSPYNDPKENPNTKDEAYGVNSVMALSGLAGMGLVNSDKRSSKRLGKSLLLGPVVGSTAYHATRNLGGGATGRLLALIAGYTTGFAGGQALDELVD